MSWKRGFQRSVTVQGVLKLKILLQLESSTSQFTQAAVFGSLSRKSRRLLETQYLPYVSSLSLAASCSSLSDKTR